MASPGPTSRQSSRWGSLLQQAVAGVESRLDTILADGGEDAQTKGSKSDDARKEQPGLRPAVSASPPARGEKGLSRASSTSKTQDRLQERLARAMVKKDNARLDRTPSPSSSGMPSPSASPALDADSPRTSIDIKVQATAPEEHLRASTDDRGDSTIQTRLDVDSDGHELASTPGAAAMFLRPGTDPPSRQSMDSQASYPSQRSMESTAEAMEASAYQAPPDQSMDGSRAPVKSVEEYEALVAQMRSDHEVAELRRQEETHDYMERIDALQAKLHYLAKETGESARNAAASAANGGLEQKLAEKDGQIALLMEEGQKLSKTELKHMTAIKKLRASAKGEEKRLVEAQKMLDRANRDANDVRQRLSRAESAERRANDRLKGLSRIEKDLENVKSERDSNSSLVSNLKAQLAQALEQMAEVEKKVQTDALETERKLVAELGDDLSNAKIEKELYEERARAEMRNLKEKAEREKERASMAEVELRGELAMLESKMEVLRARAEEVSTGATGDAQATLLRQIETLQTQYAVASENWQGIEASLVTRVTNLEKDKEELSRKESEIKRKAREINLKSKRAESELESTNSKMQSLEQELAESREEASKLRRRLEQSEAVLRDAQAEFAQEKQGWDALLSRRIEQEKNKWRDDVAQLTPGNQNHRNESIASRIKSPNLDLSNMPSRRFNAMAGEVSNHTVDRPLSRRASTQPSRTPEHGTPVRRDSFTQVPQLSIGGGIPESPSIHTNDADDVFENTSSPHRTVNDMISGSVGAAGPSVQLVERMSAAVRRLESEKAASKEELSRLSTQRDEARTEVVSLMREVEQKRAADERIVALEAEIVQINGRYQTTLEMLGEKSELVDELKADVADVKKIYRELVDSTMR